jgi:hypothetical protein
LISTKTSPGATKSRGAAEDRQAIVFSGRRYQAAQVNRLNRAGLLEEYRWGGGGVEFAGNVIGIHLLSGQDLLPLIEHSLACLFNHGGDGHGPSLGLSRLKS